MYLFYVSYAGIGLGLDLKRAGLGLGLGPLGTAGLDLGLVLGS